MEQFHGTTIVCVRRNGQAAIAGDGQVTFGESLVMKSTAKKVRKIYNDKVLCGFAGATADAFTLLERFEAKLQKHQGKLAASAIELAKDWRMDKYLRNLEAMLIVADAEVTLILTGNGDVVEPEGGIATIGSGGSFALAAARALMENTDLGAKDIAQKALSIAGDICIFTNHNQTIETIEAPTRD